MASGTRARREALRIRLMTKCERFSPQLPYAVSMKHAALQVLNLNPIGDHEDTSDTIADDIRLLLPPPSTVFTASYFSSPAFPVNIIKETASLYNCLEIPTSVIDALDDETKSNPSAMAHVWLACVYNADIEKVNVVVEQYKRVQVFGQSPADPFPDSNVPIVGLAISNHGQLQKPADGSGQVVQHDTTAEAARHPEPQNPVLGQRPRPPQPLTLNNIMCEPTPTEMAFGELVISFTTNFELMWNDQKSGARHDVSFFHPIPPDGFHALATIGRPDYRDANGLEAALCVKESPGEWVKPPLAEPMSYAFIWDDKKSGARLGGSCWRPIPPNGYVALGDIFQSGYDMPNLDKVRCVAEELVTEAAIGPELWLDHKSGRNVQNLGTWEIVAANALRDTVDGVFAVNSFVAVTGKHAYDKPTAAPVAYNLRLPLPITIEQGPTKPSLDSRISPPSETNPNVDRIVAVPFTSVIDEDKTLAWKVENSPFYNVERVVDYRLILFIDNDTAIQQDASKSVTTGISQEKSETFSHTTGITVSQEAGIEAGGFTAGASVSLTYSFGYSSTTVATLFREETETVELKAAADTAAAAWTEYTEFRSRRSDGSKVAEPLAFDPTDTAYVFDHFPKSAAGKTTEGAKLSYWRHRLNIPSTRGRT